MFSVGQMSEKEELLNEVVNTGRLASATKRFSSWLDTLLYQERFGG